MTVIDEAPVFGAGLSVVRRMAVRDELAEHGVAMHPGSTSIRIEDGQVCFADASGQMQTVAADHVIVARGAAGDTTLAEQLTGAGQRVYPVGDCQGVGYIEGAMRGAARAVAQILA